MKNEQLPPITQEEYLGGHFKTRKGKSTKILITLLILALVGLVVYISYDYLTEKNDIENNQIFINGASYYEQLLLQELAQCKQVPRQLGNQTVNLVLMECLG